MSMYQPSMKRTKVQKVRWVGLDCAQQLNPNLVEWWSPTIGGSDSIAVNLVIVETVIHQLHIVYFFVVISVYLRMAQLRLESANLTWN